MPILITGGTGYIGSHVCVEMLNAGYDIIVIDNLSNSSDEALSRVKEITGKGLVFHRVDLLDTDSLDTVFRKHEIDAVMHFAGLKAVGESEKIPLKYYHNNVAGTINLLKKMSEHSVKKIVFSSSATVYGAPKMVPITEDFPLSTSNPYGRTKLIIEDILRDLHKSDTGINIMILRYFNPAGAHQSGRIGESPRDIPNNLLPYISRVAVGGLPHLSVFGNDYPTPDGTGIRDYIHVTDLARGHLYALQKLSEYRGVFTYNLGAGRGYSVLEIVSAFERASGKKIPYVITGRRPGDIPVCYADPSRANNELGWKAELGIDDICADAWRWQSRNPDGY